jgi:hypothetical protein
MATLEHENTTDVATEHLASTPTGSDQRSPVTRRFVLPRMSPAARDLLEDPAWAQKLRRGLDDSRAGRVRTLREHRKQLED